MNKGGLINKTGELIKEIEALVEEIGPLRKEQARAKFNYEQSMQVYEDLQQFNYYNISINPDIDWENPNPVLTAEGTPMPEFDAQYRMSMLNFLLQENKELNEARGVRDMNKDIYYEKETTVITLMEQIGVLKAELGALAAQARLLTDGS